MEHKFRKITVVMTPKNGQDMIYLYLRIHHQGYVVSLQQNPPYTKKSRLKGSIKRNKKIESNKQ